MSTKYIHRSKMSTKNIPELDFYKEKLNCLKRRMN